MNNRGRSGLRASLPLGFWRGVATYHAEVTLRRIISATLGLRRRRPEANTPPVTLFMSNLDTRASMYLALHTLERTTSYPNYRLWVADSGSTDGSVELLRSYRTSKPLEITASPVRVSHQAWLDRVAREVTTPYWVAIDSDMLFVGRDWLRDMIERLERDPTLYLLAAERKPRGRHPVGKFVDGVADRDGKPGPILHRVSFSSWLFCMRTSLWGRLDNPTFAYEERLVGEGGELAIFDTGGQLLEQMEDRGLRYEFMPASFRRKYYHYGNMTWFGWSRAEGNYARLKHYQRKDVERRSRSLGMQ